MHNSPHQSFSTVAPALSGYRKFSFTLNVTRSVAIAEGPRDALCHLKFCQLLHNCTKNFI